MRVRVRVRGRTEWAIESAVLAVPAAAAAAAAAHLPDGLQCTPRRKVSKSLRQPDWVLISSAETQWMRGRVHFSKKSEQTLACNVQRVVQMQQM
jgi:hypothetical protein